MKAFLCIFLAVLCVTANAKTIPKGNGSGSFTVSRSEVGPGDVVAVSRGTYSFASFDHLKGAAGNPVIVDFQNSILTGNIAIPYDSFVVFQNYNFSGVSGQYGCVQVEHNYKIQLVNGTATNCTADFLGVNWHTFPAFDGKNTALKMLVGSTVTNLVMNGCGAFSSNFKGFANVIDSSLFQNVTVLGSTVVQQLNYAKFFRTELKAWAIHQRPGLIPRDASGNTADQGYFEIGGSPTIDSCIFYPGWGWGVRVIHTSLGGEPVKIFGNIRTGGTNYGGVDYRHPDTWDPMEKGGNAYIENNTFGNQITLNNYSTAIAVVYKGVDQNGHKDTVFVRRNIRFHSFNRMCDQSGSNCVSDTVGITWFPPTDATKGAVVYTDNRYFANSSDFTTDTTIWMLKPGIVPIGARTLPGSVTPPLPTPCDTAGIVKAYLAAHPCPPPVQCPAPIVCPDIIITNLTYSNGSFSITVNGKVYTFAAH